MNVREIQIRDHRAPEHDVHSLLLSRWSPRAMTGESLSDEELESLFEAARWAPSSYNRQPWRFLYARRESEHWDRFLDLLVDFNRQWAKEAAVLLVILSHRITEEDEPSRTHSFDTGAAWQNLALQGNALGLVVHGMEGFDYEEARRRLDIPEEYRIEAMAAVGRPADVENLPQKLQERERPSDRKEIEEITYEGSMTRRSS